MPWLERHREHSAYNSETRIQFWARYQQLQTQSQMMAFRLLLENLILQQPKIDKLETTLKGQHLLLYSVIIRVAVPIQTL